VFEVVDTGGLIFDENADDIFAPQIRDQVRHLSSLPPTQHRLVTQTHLRPPLSLTPLPLPPPLASQALLALDECVAAVFVTDGQTGPTTLDEEIARFLRTKRKPVVVAVNKCESPTMSEAWAAMFYSLGLGHPFAVSGLHGTGIAEVLEEIKPHIYQVTSPLFTHSLASYIYMGPSSHPTYLPRLSIRS
jgi:predicted GTPase